MLNVLPSARRVSRRAAAIAAKQTGRPAILQQDWTETGPGPGPALGPDWAVLCDWELVVRWSMCWTERRCSEGWREEAAGWGSGLEGYITISGPLLSHWLFGSKILKKENTQR